MRIEITTKNDIRDVVGEQLSSRINKKCRSVDVYNIDGDLDDYDEIFLDPVTQYSGHSLFSDRWRIEIGLLPGVTDNVGHTASEAIRDRSGNDLAVYYSRMYAIEGDLSEYTCEEIASELHNPLIEKFIIHKPNDVAEPYIPRVEIKHEPVVETTTLHMSQKRFEALAKQKVLSLSYDEFQAIKKHFKIQEVIDERKVVGLDNKITDVELEALAQTWSEHCKHRIFNAAISYEENGEKHAINSLFKTFIAGATEQVKKPYVVSVFVDNGGIIKFNPDYDIAVKVETHNSPSALDPYGGALTGILGVQRDILGTGIGANPIANIDVLCFGYPDETEVPKGVLHPKVIFDGVVKGIEHGGNKTGIPTVNGSIVFDKDYTCRPLVYAGTIGLLPSQINGRKTHEKIIKPGYLALMVGGRIGKDGIHGATFSSMQIDSSTPQSVVQIGDPITQKRAQDLILEARDLGLYDAITDNGAGGLSSSIGELAQISGGCEIYLDKCPLKYPGLDPWEILVSESQERMTLACPPENLAKIEELAKVHGVEVTAVGKFTNSGKFHIFYNEKTVGFLDLEFLHGGNPKMSLKASWKKLLYPEPLIGEFDPLDVLIRLLKSPNITSKERIIRQYDHEVKGTSVIKPIMLGPSDAGVIRPVYDSNEGLVISHGICPRYVQDGYVMATLAFDEAIRNAIAVGARFGYLACLDNFSWPDPVQSAKTPDGEQKLGSLVRACLGMYDCATNYNVPIISGKDSMKNDYYSGSQKYSIPPTLLVTVVGKIDDISKAMSSEFKNPGDLIYVVGTTKDELGGSEYYRLYGAVGNNPPELDFDEHSAVYKALSGAIEDRLLSSVHDISDGGLAVAFSESALGIGFGAEMDLELVPTKTKRIESLMFSESSGRFVVSVPPEKVSKFEYAMSGCPVAKVGRVRGDKRFIIKRNDEVLINEPIENIKKAFNSGV